MAQVVALVDDLFFQAKLLETAKQVGVEAVSYTHLTKAPGCTFGARGSMK